MATLASIATGNFTDAGTWGVINAGSYTPVWSASLTVGTAYSSVRSASFTPGAITVSHLAFRVGTRSGTTTGTLSVHLALNSTHVEVAGTLVTINMADLPAFTSDLGWVMLKLASPVTLAAATAYELEIKTSSASQLTVYRTSTTVTDVCKFIVTTTTQAPAVNDDLIIAGEYTGAGTSNAFTVTMDNTATTEFGSGENANEYRGGLLINSLGTLTWGVTASTDYYLKIKGHLIIFYGGTMNMGTVGTECPRNTTMTLLMNCTSLGQYGIYVKDGATFRAQGLSRTSGKDIVWCRLNADEAVNSTSLGVDADTGWLDNDQIVIAPTKRVVAQYELGTLNGDAGASTLTVDGFAGAGGGLAFAHDGTGNVKAEVINLTRNIKISGASIANVSYMRINQTGTVDFDWVEMFWLGYNSAELYGIYWRVGAGGSCTFHYCSRYGFHASSNSVGFYMQPTADGGTLEIEHCVAYRCPLNITIYLGVGNLSTSFVINDCVVIGSAYGFGFLNLTTGTASNLVAAGNSTGGFYLGSGYSQGIATISDLLAHDNGDGFVINMSSGAINSFSFGFTASNLEGRRNTGNGITLATHAVKLTINNAVLVGNASVGLRFAAGGSLRDTVFNDAVIEGEASYSSNYGIYTDGNNIVPHGVIFNNCTFGVGVGHTLGDFQVVANASLSVRYNKTGFVKCTFSSATKIVGTGGFDKIHLYHQDNYLFFMEDDLVTDSDSAYVFAGILSKEVTTKRTGNYSLKMTPKSTSNKLSTNSFFAPVLNGNTITPSVYVYEDASYNGARARLILKANAEIGITDDVLIDTATVASDGAWEQLTGTTAAATADGVMEFIIDCDGTAGNLFVDDFTI